MIRFENNRGFDHCDIIENAQARLSIGIIDADLLDGGTRHPNLALLKISGYCKSHGHKVRLVKSYDEIINTNARVIDPSYDMLVLSRVFKFTKLPPEIDHMIRAHLICYGGTGFFEINGPNLPPQVEHFMPDYNLYDDYIEWKTGGDQKKKKSNWDDYLSYSIGFTTRGCIRHCEFCVNRLSNRVVIRLMTDEKAKLLNSIKYHGDYIFAFDHYRLDIAKEKKEVEQTIKGLEIWRKHSTKSTKLYVLVAYDGQDENDIEGTFYRIKILMEYGCLPYIMRFEEYNNSRFKSMYIQIARWCNQPSFFKKMSFRQYCVRNEEYHQGIHHLRPKGKYSTELVFPKGFKPKKKYCKCYQTMLDFEEEFPQIAEKYFDLRYEDINKLNKVDTL